MRRVMLYSQDPSAESAPLQHETVLLQPQAKTFCLLNQTAAFLWNEISAPIAAELIAQRLAGAFEGVRPEQVTRDVDSTLWQLVSLGFVTTSETSFFFQAEDGIRDLTVTGVQTCALPI